jgi:Leucine-rich repeat (LRR) protein
MSSSLKKVTLNTLAPSPELQFIWDRQQNKNAHIPPPILKPMVVTSDATSLLQLRVENQNLEEIFRFTVACVNLKAVFVSGNRIITRDLPYMCKLAELVKIDISKNKIHFVPESITNLTKLRFLQVEHNELVGWSQLDAISSNQHIISLSVHHNPCSKVFGTRDYIVQTMPNVRVVDNLVVCDFERKYWKDLNLPAPNR